MKVLYLHAEVMGYTMATIRALAERGAEVHVVYWDHKKLTPYQIPEVPGVFFYLRSQLSVAEMMALADRLSPAVTVVAGWMDTGYLRVVRRLRSRGAVVVTGFDDQWHGTWRQKSAAVIGRFGCFSWYFSHAWVSGTYQFEFARRLGFDRRRILYDLLAADLDLFDSAYRTSLEVKGKAYPHCFLFVGRFEPVKGLDTLLQAWSLLGQNKRDWELHLIGNGSLKDTLASTRGVVVKEFMQPDRLATQVANAGCFILPSRGEPWGVVVQEYAAAGLPLISSDAVGAASTFLISGWNGYLFKVSDVADLARTMSMIVRTPDPLLLAMGERSRQLANRITPEMSAASLLSAVGV